MTPRAIARFRPLVGALALASACGPFVILEETGSESTEMGDDTEDATPPPPVTTSTSTSTTSTSTSTTTTTATTVDPTGDEPSYCAQACIDLADCISSGGNPDDFACIDGFCEYVGEIPPCDPATCDDLMIGFCTELDGVSVCATWCTDDSACVAGFTECSGQDDAGNSICAPIPCFGTAEGEPCEIVGVGQIGVCTNGECTCTEDAECTIQGFACNA